MPTAAVCSVDPTKRFYELNAQTYSATTLTRDLESVLAEFAQSVGPVACVLDLGCGAGHDLKSLVRIGSRAVGLDYAEPMARLARQRASAPVVVADMRELPFADRSFEGVWASASLLHLASRGLRDALRECRRVMKAGGTFFASVKYGFGEVLDAHGRFFALHDEASWASAVSSAGFKIGRMGINDHVPSSGADRPVTRWLTSFVTAV
jgi:ubiquinone/menaquinone biosynthesis C-methylase UbiE